MTPRRSRPGDSKLAVAYLRVSTDDQKLGPEAQRSAIEAWAAREGVKVAAWHVDQGVRGGSDLDDRPALVAVLGELRALRAGVLVVAKRDRLARDVAIAATIERAAKACGAKVVSADGAGKGDGPADAFMRAILDAAAAYERALHPRPYEGRATGQARSRRAGRRGPLRLHRDGRGRARGERGRARRHRARSGASGVGSLAPRHRRRVRGCGARVARGAPVTLTQVARILAPGVRAA